ncbi:MAG: ATP-dependent helicase [Sphingobium sp.]|nr:MAG: ATP-dependent helicase [Sphingobium sp.]
MQGGTVSLVAGGNVGDAGDEAARERIVGAPAEMRLLVEAGPGTGKTQMAALRLAGLVQSQLSPSQILVLSFSRSAVRTLTRRMTSVAGTDEHIVEELRHVSVRTFDAWAFRILRLLGRQPEELLRHGHDENIVALTSAIQGPARDDVRHVIGDRRHLIVDEFQDLPGVRGDLVLALLELLSPLSGSQCGFTILGDPAQAIYGFSAKHADGTGFPTSAEYWQRIVAGYGDRLETVRLTRNHRSSPPLAELSARLRGLLLGDLPEEAKLEAVREAMAGLPEVPQMDMAAIGDQGSAAVLTRTNGEALRVLTRLMGGDLDGPERKLTMRAASYATLPPAWIAALLRQVQSPGVTRSQFDRVYDHLTGVWDAGVRLSLELPDVDTAWSRLAQAAGATAEATSFDISALRARLNWPDVFPDDQPLVDDGLVITTVHQSKGMEFDVVTILDSARDHSEAEGEGEHSEEANVSYVGMTRAATSLRRSPAKSIYTPPTNWTFRNDRTRLCNWRHGWINLEMGQKGDVDPLGFVDPALHEPGGAGELQQYLLENARSLEGRKVLLCKYVEDKRAIWRIHLQTGDGAGRLLGTTSQQLTYDLLHILHDKGYALPSRIFNLRISGVGTLTTEAECALEAPERSSRLWLGVSLFGTGDFKPFKPSKGAK